MTQFMSPSVKIGRSNTARLGRAFRNDTRASTGMMFALMFVPAFGLIACAIDYSRAMTVKSALNSAADNANFAAIGSNTEGYKAAMSQVEDGHVTLAETDAKNFFQNQTKNVPNAQSIVPTVSVMKTGNSIVSSVSYTAQMNTSFAGVFGIKTTNISGTTTAAISAPVFQDFYLLLDSSPSMAVAATTADITKMVNNTPDQCAFACHESDLPGSDYYALAKRLGVTTRMDVLRTATQQLFSTAKALRSSPDQFGMATYTFDTALHKNNDLTQDMTAAATAASTIDTMVVPYQGYNNDQDTNWYPAFDGMNTIIPTPATGAGSSTTNRQQVLFFVSDGVADYYNGSQRTYAPIPATLCTRLKNKGITIAVLYTPYLPLPTNAWYNTYIAPMLSPTDTVAAAMQACATTGLYFKVSPNQGIADAMNALFLKVVGMAHLTK